MRIYLLLSTLLLTGFQRAYAQSPSPAIGQWRSFYPYKAVSSIATDGKTIYAAAGVGFFSYNAANGEIITHSKVDGMSDAGTDQIGYDTTTGAVVVSYTNGNIDLYRNQSFFNIPALRLKNISGSKQVADIYTTGGKAYLSTSFGVLVLDLQREEVKESYEFTVSGQSLAARGVRIFQNFLYAATPRGLYRAPVTSRTLQAFPTWQRVATDTLSSIAVSGGRLWGSSSRGVLRLNASASDFDTVYRSGSVVRVDPAPDGGVFVSEFYMGGTAFFGRVKPLTPAGILTADSFRAGSPAEVITLADNSVWCADAYDGLSRPARNNGADIIRPNGPNDVTSYDILARDGSLVVAHGGYGATYVPQGFRSGLSRFDAGTLQWSAFTNPDVSDIVGLLEEADGTLLFGSLNAGLGAIAKDGSYTALKDGSIIEPAFDDPASFPVLALARDLRGNLVLGQFKAKTHETAIRTPQGVWGHYTAPGASSSGGLSRSAAGLLVDDANQKWWFQPQGGGVFVYNDGNTPDDLSDDASRQLLAGAGGGGLPSNTVLSLVKDREGAIWVGTNNGIGIYSCAGSIIKSPCDADWPIVQFDAFAGRLFENERVNTIAVDGGNRKWVGTNNGVWLLSPDAQKIVSRFTADNSPMPSNIVQKIAVDNTTGDVYIGTDRGLVSYRGTATGGAESAGGVQTFPNPVPSGYGGTIAIRGLTTDADVRITDISGQLVYRATAAGGQAVWNGLDYTGRRPQSGVYLVLVTNKDGSQTAQGKLVFLE